MWNYLNFSARIGSSAAFFAVIFSIQGCGTIAPSLGPSSPVAELASQSEPPDQENLSILKSAEAIFSRAYNSSAKERVTNDASGAYIIKAQQTFYAGVVMIDLQCSKYLDDLGQANQRSKNRIQQTILGNGVVAAIMGVGGSAAKEIAGVSSIFSFTAASQETEAINFLFADASSSILKLVNKAKAEFKTRTQEDGILRPQWFTSANHMQVMQYLLAYEELCRPAKIRELINQALSAAEIAPEKTLSDAGANYAAATIAKIKKILGSIADDIDEGDAISLYKEYVSGSKSAVTLTNGKTVPPSDVKKLDSVFLSIKAINPQLAARWLPALADQPVPPPAGAAVNPGAAAAGKPAGNAQDSDSKLLHLKKFDQNIFMPAFAPIEIQRSR